MNKTILITGASSGIGEACARKFASEGARLILIARSTDKLEALAQHLKERYNTECQVISFDVCDKEAAKTALLSLPDNWKAIDVLINNAGLALGVDKQQDGNIDEWEVMIDTNVKALLSMTRLVVPGMVERGRGHIINIGRKCILRNKGCSEGLVRRSAHRPCGYSSKSYQREAWSGRDKLLGGEIQRRPGYG